MTRCLLIDGQLAKKFWLHAMDTATTIRNWSSKRSKCQSPYELFTGKKPPLDRLRVYGCVTYMAIRGVNNDKLDAKAYEGKLIGYGKDHAGYVIFVPERDTIYAARDIRSDESKIKMVNRRNSTEFVLLGPLYERVYRSR